MTFAACAFGVFLILLGSLTVVGSVTAAVSPYDDLPQSSLIGRFHRRAESGGTPFALSGLSCLAAGVILVMAAC